MNHNPVRFSQPFLDTLTEDEAAILYYVYYKVTGRIIDFRSVKVTPVYEMFLATDNLTEEGAQVLISCFLKIAEEYQLPSYDLKQKLAKQPIPESSMYPCMSGI